MKLKLNIKIEDRRKKTENSRQKTENRKVRRQMGVG
jgi:hypothetical protein